jgi:long-subunit acyl-CoA synthetase (AMP-forming)
VIGDERPYNVALLVLDSDALSDFTSRYDLDAEALGALGAAESVVTAVADEVSRANRALAPEDRVSKFKILDEDRLPPRADIAERYADEIEALYGD